MMGTTVGLRVVSILSTIVLARLLDPADFGIIALVFVVISTVELIAPLGLPAALIQRQVDREQAAYQVFLVTVTTGVLLYLAVGLGAGWLAGLLGNERIAQVIPVMGLLVVLGGLTRVPEALMEKEMMFKKLSAIMIATDILYIACALGLAALGYGVWSLVIAHLAKAVLALGMSWAMSPSWAWLRRKPWNGALMRDLLRFGMSNVGSRSVYFFFTNVDNLVVGRQLGTTALGFYSKAFDFTTKTVDNINRTIGIVLFPSYARIQHERERLSAAYLTSLRMISSVTVPLAMGIFITAPELVPVVLGSKWVPMVAILQILAFMSLVKPLSSTTSALFNAMGRPGYNLRAGLVVSAVLVPLMFALLGMGPEGVAMAVFAAHVAGFAYNVYQVHTLLPGTAPRMLKTVLPALGSAAVMVLGIWISKQPLAAVTGAQLHPLTLAGMILVGIGVYGAMIYLFQRDLVVEVRGLLMHRREAGNA
jgi:PST family polysaccharide transporter